MSDKETSESPEQVASDDVDVKQNIIYRAVTDSLLFSAFAIMIITLGFDFETGLPFTKESTKPNVPRVATMYQVEPFNDWPTMRAAFDKSPLFSKKGCLVWDMNPDDTSCSPFPENWAPIAKASTCDTVGEGQWPSGCTCIKDVVEKAQAASNSSGKVLHKVTDKKTYMEALKGCALRGQMPSKVLYQNELSVWNMLLTVFFFGTFLNVMHALDFDFNNAHDKKLMALVVFTLSYLVLFTTVGISLETTSDFIILAVHAAIFGVNYMVYGRCLSNFDDQASTDVRTNFKNCYIIGWFCCHSLPQYAIVVACLRNWTEINILMFIITVTFFIGVMMLCSAVIRWGMATSTMPQIYERHDVLTYSFVLIVASIVAYAWTNLPLLVPGGNQLYILLSMAYIIFLGILIYGADVLNTFSIKNYDLKNYWYIVNYVELTVRIFFFVLFTFFIMTPDIKDAAGVKITV